MRKLLVLAALSLAAVVAPASAGAAVPQVFTTSTSPVTCAVQSSGATAGQRWCGTASGTTVASWDGVPIDVSVTLPPAAGADANYPVIGIFHGWGGTKITPSNAATQRFVTQGYAVFSVTDRGWGSSCGGAPTGQFPNGTHTQKAGACAKGYIHLMHNAFEVRDVQYLLGKLADEGVIDPQRIGATGGSYGGGLSMQLGALKDRVQLQDGSLIQWRSPGGKAMRIAATAPEFGWSDLAQSLMPNGSGLDYVADAPYRGAQGDHRAGIQKQSWNASLFNAGLAIGYYAPVSGAGYPDPQANLIGWNAADSTGGPYDGVSLVDQQLNELADHGAYYTDGSEAPAPALLSNGWNDDLFPVDEAVRYYNKVRSAHPDAAIKMFHINFGHNPRAGGIAAADQAKLTAAEDEWFAHYVKGTGATPADAQGGVDIITSACPSGAAGQRYSAPSWASLAPGEIRIDGSAPQTIQAPGVAPSQSFTASGTTVCTTQAAGDNASAATYKSDPIPSDGVTIAGSPTVIAELDTTGANDMVAARLYDVDPAGAQVLLARGLYRPTGVGAGFTKQVFQLHPQAWKAAAGHVLKLELLSQDSPYARLATNRASIGVRNLELRLPTIDAPGSAGGLVQEPAPKYLPPGYVLARDVPNMAPGAPHISAGSNPNATGVFALAWNASQPAASLFYTLQHRDSDDPAWSDLDGGLTSASYTFTSAAAEGEGTWRYRVNAHEDDGTQPTAFSGDSAPIKVDKSAPGAPALEPDRAPDYAGDGGWYRDTVTVTASAPDGDPLLTDGSDGSGVDLGLLPGPFTYSTSGAHTATARATDAVGNVSDETARTVQLDADAPTLQISCPDAVLLHAAGATATVVAADAESGLGSDPSGSVAIDTGSVGPKTVTRTATDRVGHDRTRSCTTQVRYLYGGLQQPVNPDGSSIFKLGSTIPLKMALTDAGSNAVGGAIARVEVAKITDSVTGTFVEAVSTSAATSGNLFREADGKYMFNLSTKDLSPGTWAVKVTLDDGTPGYTTRISLR